MSPAGAALGQAGPEDPTGRSGRRSRILGTGRPIEGARATWIAVASTAIFFGALAVVVVRSPGWPVLQDRFVNFELFREFLPGIASAFLKNVAVFMIAETLVLVLALVIAVLRSLPGPVFFPLRLIALIYTDFFRGVPLVLVIFALGFGAPALGLQGVPNSPFFWAVVSLTLVYSAYVAEVYRAGIESVHESQVAAARSLGLSRWQSLRFVVLPQAIRRVVPPLLNDFVGLQKDSALISFIGPVESFRQAQIDSASTFNYTSYLVSALFFVALTIPLSRFTDWLILRDRRRRETGAVL